ncbi:DUF664 domain-containing protein [Micromonospora peucetia]|uniref:mycothiol transferase n=1 Tax=Micromonospora peucetia TaxID=47871 RepID=UPI00331ACEB6
MIESQREAVPRSDGGELGTALAFLSFARSCVLKKVAGLSEEQLRHRLVVSDTTLLGLVQHLTDDERYWRVRQRCDEHAAVVRYLRRGLRRAACRVRVRT